MRIRARPCILRVRLLLLLLLLVLLRLVKDAFLAQSALQAKLVNPFPLPQFGPVLRVSSVESSTTSIAWLVKQLSIDSRVQVHV